MHAHLTEQEKFWAGDFGNEYINRNQGKSLISSNISLFSKVLKNTNGLKSIIEFGSNIGLNLVAIKTLLPDIEISAIEINSSAVEKLKSNFQDIIVYNQSVLDFKPDYQREFVLIKGVLIHINPDMLNKVYDILYNCSKRYICIAEYYNPTPIEVKYRGLSGKLFKRDFTGEVLDRFPNLKLIDYGFVYHRDTNFPQDDITYFLLEK